MEIRERELNYFVQLYSILSGISAFLAGFSYNALRTTLPEDTSTISSAAYLGITAAALGCEVCAVCNGAFCSVLGPGMALRGN